MPTEEHGSVTGTMICQNWDEWRAMFCIKSEDNRTTRYVRQHKAGIGLWNIRQGW
jgi:hypothetical protein